MRPGDFERVFKALNQAGVRYLVVGGVAAVLHGVSRLTVDVDICLSLNESNLGPFWETVTRLGYRPSLPVSLQDLSEPATVRSWREERNLRALKFWDPQDNLALGLDLVLELPFDFDEAHERRVIFKYHGLDLPVMAKADLIRMKKASGRTQDLSDVEILQNG